MHNPMNQGAGGYLAAETTPDGQERLATQSERDEVNNRIRHANLRSDQEAVRGNTSAPQSPSFLAYDAGRNSMAMPSGKDPLLVALAALPAGVIKTQVTAAPHSPLGSGVDVPANFQREAGDQVNGFLLCTLVSESAKRLKARAGRTGISLPMTIITRCVLRAYRREAKSRSGALSGRSPDLAALVRLDGIILKDVLTSNSGNQGRPGRNRG